MPCAHLDARLAIADAAIRSHPSHVSSYLIIGDSISEAARWPNLCGHAPINVGIGYARTDTFLGHAKRLADSLRPDLVVVALGTNDVLTTGRVIALDALLGELRGYTVVYVPSTLGAAPRAVSGDGVRSAARINAETIGDGIHLNAADYVAWHAAIAAAACDATPGKKPPQS